MFPHLLTLLFYLAIGALFVVLSHWKLTNRVLGLKLTGPPEKRELWSIWVILPLYLVFATLLIWNFIDSLDGYAD